MCSSPPLLLPRKPCSLWTEVGPLAALSLVQLGFRLPLPPPSPQSYWLLPSSLWSIHPAGTGPRDKGRLSPSLSLQADGRHQLPTTSLCDNLSHSFPFGDTPPHSQLILSALLSLDRPWPSPESPVTRVFQASISPKATSPYPCRMP